MDQLGNLLDRPRLYYNIDGLAELGSGLLGLGVAVYLSLSANSPWRNVSWWILAGLVAAIHFGTKAIKNRITYPRTGYVEYRSSERRRASIASAVIAALVPVGLTIAVRRHWEIPVVASLVGLLFAAVYAYRVGRVARWKWAVASAMAAGAIAIGFVPAEWLAALAHDSLATHRFLAILCGTLVFSFMTNGALLAISGGISFWLYLRHAPAPSPEAQ